MGFLLLPADAMFAELGGGPFIEVDAYVVKTLDVLLFRFFRDMWVVNGCLQPGNDVLVLNTCCVVKAHVVETLARLRLGLLGYLRVVNSGLQASCNSLRVFLG